MKRTIAACPGCGWGGGGEEPPICLQIGEDQHLEVPRKSRKHSISTFQEWVRCFSVYAHQLVAHQPMRSADLMGYLYLITTCQAEFNFQAYLAYDVAFRRKASKFHISAWGQIDPQLYLRPSGAGKAKPRAWCFHCLAPTHSSPDCPNAGGSAKRARAARAGPKKAPTALPEGICHDYNRGRCTRSPCAYHHICTTPGCFGQHPSLHCPKARHSRPPLGGPSPGKP